MELAQDGPASWPRTPVNAIKATVKRTGETKVSNISQTDTSVSFHVSRVGTPVLVKVSYFPNWHASGADGPWRVTPNLMVVIPTSHDVTLNYGGSSADTLGLLATLVGLIALVARCSSYRQYGDGGHAVRQHRLRTRVSPRRRPDPVTAA